MIRFKKVILLYLGRLLKELQCWLDDNLPEWKEKSYLLGVSGGVDSSVLVHLFKQIKVPFAVAHCNFGLRGAESDQDEVFVKKMAESIRVKFYIKHFDTPATKASEGGSIQMLARNLRYDWFEHLRREHTYDFVVVGSHGDDLAETLLINLTRGTGIKGMHGILPLRNGILRPLLPFSRADILNYATQKSVVFREDSSNENTKYVRNRIRKDVVPVLKEINPRFAETMRENASRFHHTELIYQKEIKRQLGLCSFQADGSLGLKIDQLKKLDPLETYLFEFLQPYGFSEITTNEIALRLNGISGKQFLSSTHRAIVDREVIFISKLEELMGLEADVMEGHQEINGPIRLSFQKKAKDSEGLNQGSHIALFDFEKLKFPLQIRPWILGDKFIPLGMKSFKKVSDFLIDIKLPIHEKEKTFVLISNHKIVWLIGHRIDDRFKISPETKTIYKVERKS